MNYDPIELYTEEHGILQTISQTPFPNALLLVSATMKMEDGKEKVKNPAQTT